MHREQPVFRLSLWGTARFRTRASRILSGVIAETFNLFADCAAGSSCAPPLDNPPVVDSTTAGAIVTPPQSLEYLPGLVQTSSVAVPSCSVGTGANPDYWPAVAGCDQSTVYQCGVQSSIASPANQIDLTENPGGAARRYCVCDIVLDRSDRARLCERAGHFGTRVPTPTKSRPGLAMPLPVCEAILLLVAIRSSPYRSMTAAAARYIRRATCQCNNCWLPASFHQSVNTDGSLNVTVLNVAGCGNSATNAPIPGTSPVPIRLVTPP